MRRFAGVMVLLAAAQSAQAADLPDLTSLPVLRGALREETGTRVVRWRGFYIGGQAAYGSSNHSFTGATKDIAAQQLALTTIEQEFGVSGWPVMGGSVSHTSTAFGGFAGYNGQWDDVVLGLEANYMRGNFGAQASGTMSRQIVTSNEMNHVVTSTAAASVNVTDVLTLRARAAYVWNSFLPYMFGGIAVGMSDSNRSSSIRDIGTYVGSQSPQPIANYDVTYSKAEGETGKFRVGYTFGAGSEVMLFGGVFARGEWEYVRLTGPVATSINTVRGGLGYRF